jgi:MFS family permease
MGFTGLFVTCFLVSGQVYINGLAADDLRTSTQGLLSLANGTGQLAGNLLAGLLRDATGGALPPTFAVGAAITAVILVVFVVGFRLRRAAV